MDQLRQRVVGLRAQSDCVLGHGGETADLGQAIESREERRDGKKGKRPIFKSGLKQGPLPDPISLWRVGDGGGHCSSAIVLLGEERDGGALDEEPAESRGVSDHLVGGKDDEIGGCSRIGQVDHVCGYSSRSIEKNRGGRGGHRVLEERIWEDLAVKV